MSNSPGHAARRRTRATAKARQNRIARNRPGYGNQGRIVNDEFRRSVERMNNPQRTRWSRAKHPGLKDRDVEKLQAFVSPAPATRQAAE